MADQRKWPAALVAAAGVAVTVFAGYLLATWPPEPPTSPAGNAGGRAGGTVSATGSPAPGSKAPGSKAPDSPATDAAETRTPDAGAPLMVVLGDEFTADSPLSTGPEWPRLVADDLGWRLSVDAVPQSGYLYPGTGEAYGARVDAVLAQEPDVVVVAGGKNDLGRFPAEEIAARADEVVGRLVEGAPEAEVVVLSPFSKGRPGPLTGDLTEALRGVAADRAVTYVDVSDWLVRSADLFSGDSHHPVDEGQELIAERLLPVLETLG